ncbi:MAG: hypothetical protein HKO60_09415 [Pseudomonadales bacterium]|nr:hypothetical protein [Pseudomonadales bacterium]
MAGSRQHNNHSEIKPLKLALGLKGDGPDPVPFASTLGELVVGPKGFLSLLETQLGVAPNEVPFTRRLIQYLACIEEVNHAGAFYFDSYQADPFSVARKLLQWRDQWYEAGWRGSFTGAVPARLADMAAIETLAATQVASNIGQRMQCVLGLLEQHCTSIESITFLDALQHFPPFWQKLISAVDAQLLAPADLAPLAKPGSDLHALQHYLINNETGALDLRGDNSIVALQSGIAGDSAIPIAAHSNALLAQGKQVALLAEVRAELIDEANTTLYSPRIGLSARSSSRPLFQVLPLALELLWSPLDVRSLMQFLSHPYGPLPQRVRRVLAQSVATAPGIGGEPWNQAIAELLEHSEGNARDKLAASIKYWLQAGRFNPEQGAPCEVLVERGKRVLDWLLGRREAESDNDMRNYYAVAINQVQEFLLAIERLAESGRTLLSRDNVMRLVDDVRGSGAAVSDRNAQLLPGQAPLLVAKHSGAFHCPLQEIIWWDCQASDRVARWPWPAPEQAALQNAGVMLQSEAAQLDWLAQAWLRPILFASERCTLVLHDDTDRHHPVWDRLTANIKGLALHNINSDAAQQFLQLPLQALPARDLPAMKRWWQMPASTPIEARKQESYSSLQNYIYSPYQWLLKYAARIRPGFIEPLNDGGRLRGNLAHHLVEQFFAGHSDIAVIDITSVAAWVDKHLPVLIEQEGATLLTAGRQAECAEFVAGMRRALPALVQHLHDAGVQRVETERLETADFFGGELQGYIDLLAHAASGQEIIVDLKWGGRNYQRKNLREGSYLQLAVYAQLRESQAVSKSGNAQLSYFILRDAQMLSLSHKLFPNAEIIDPDDGGDWQSLWRSFESSWRWRKLQIDKGLFEVTAKGTIDDQRFPLPADALDLQGYHDTFSDYGSLTGWYEQAAEPGDD